MNLGNDKSVFRTEYTTALFDSVSAIPAGFVGTARVGTDLYVGDGTTLKLSNGGTLRQIATRCSPMSTINTTNKQTMSRSRHYMRASVNSFKLLYTNWYALFTAANYVQELGSGGILTIKASIETKSGTIIPITFNGGLTTATIADKSEIFTDDINLSILKNDYFYVRTWTSNPTAIIYVGKSESSVHGEGMTYGVTTPDLTAGGTVAFGGAGLYFPSAIIGYTNVKSIALLGDSRSIGFADAYTSSAFNDLGVLAKSIGPHLPYINLGIPSQSAYSITSYPIDFNLRASLINRFCTHTISNIGINDVNIYAHSGSIAFADIQSVILRINMPFIQTTINPATTDATNTTTNANNAQRVNLNNLIRNTFFCQRVIEMADVTESSRDSGLWKLASYTADGLHESELGCNLIATSGVINPGIFGDV
jgi:hypothetical protein